MRSLSHTSGRSMIVRIFTPIATGVASVVACATPSVFGMISVNSKTAIVKTIEKIQSVPTSNTAE